MRIEKLSVHIPLAQRGGLTEEPNADATINVFHRTIRENLVADELLLDVVDYRHVPGGPGVLLVADESITSLGGEGLTIDNRREPGVHISADSVKTAKVPEATVEILRVISRAIDRALFLERAPEFAGSLRFDSSGIAVSIRDRLEPPNEARFQEWIRASLEPLAGALSVAPSPADPRGPLRIDVQFQEPARTLEGLWGRTRPS